jgi:hypothetical protein
MLETYELLESKFVSFTLDSVKWKEFELS